MLNKVLIKKFSLLHPMVQGTVIKTKKIGKIIFSFDSGNKL